MDDLTFDEATAVRPIDDGAFDWTVPAGWAQGRGAWGALSFGAMGRAILACEPDPERIMRSVSAEIVSPARVGAVRLTVSELRRGSALSSWSCLAVADTGEVVGRLSAVLAASRRDVPDYATWGMPSRPDVAPADDVPIVPVEPPFGPEFGQHLEFRPIAGIPLTGGPAVAQGYVRLRRPVPHSALTLVGLVDAWWPATLPAVTTLRPMATVGFAANLLVDPATIPVDEPLLHWGAASGAHEGFTSETRQLWSADGRLVVENLQSIVLIA